MPKGEYTSLSRVLAPPIPPEPDEQLELAFSHLKRKLTYRECLRRKELTDALNDRDRR
uniref:Uncharacterized protein n=1 Tax=Candidatus Kentrum sp. FW TaxID=2126338 RepID=A0A450U3Q1_9GAMM|nr:MAG: hypothetical protein BECKFW1821C_GA0114237_11428 [Candidatus Kentron sp. FW]